jgi:hypothetical protein
MRLVAVRYFLDRPGYGLDNSAVRLWFDPPARAQPSDLGEFLMDQRIALEGLLVEVYLDQFRSFMMLDACAAAGIEWEFGDTSPDHPAVVNIRLTDLAGSIMGGGGAVDGRALPSASHPAGSGLANVTPAGLFAFSMTIGLECASQLIVLVPGSINEYFILMWAPYMLFLSGVLQFVVGLFEVVRGNIYGATAFMAFGMFWTGNGLTVILQYYFASDGTNAQAMIAEENPWFRVVKDIYILAFVLVLLVQTFAMNKLSSVMIALLATKILVAIFASWSTGALWVEFVLGWITSAFAFYVFAVELTNQVYHRELLPEYKWSPDDSPGEVFGAQGKAGTLQGRAAQLRQAQYVMSPRRLREAAKSDGEAAGTATASTVLAGAVSTSSFPSENEKLRSGAHRGGIYDRGGFFSRARPANP